MCSVRLTQIALRFFKRLKTSLLLWNLKKSHPLLCCFLEPLTTKYCRLWWSVINFVDRFHDVGEESSLYQGEGLIIMTSKRKCVGDMMLPYWPYLTPKFYLLLWFHKAFKLIFLKACVRYFSKKNVFLRYIKPSTLKRNVTYSCFFFPSFHEHSLSLELPRAARLLKTSCFEK